MNYDVLCSAAIKAREASYSPYSKFMVGAALLCASGKIYTGCNIENAAYTPTNCAERTAIFKAISEGERHFTAIAIAAGKKGQALCEATPCGVCRQVMREFCADNFEIALIASTSEHRIITLATIFPEGFGPTNLA